MADGIMDENYRYYYQKGDACILRRKKETAIGIFLILAGIIIYCDVNDKYSIASCYVLLIIIWGVANVVKRKVFNIAERTFTVSYGGFFRKTYRFNQIEDPIASFVDETKRLMGKK